jgi:electron transfer flavoprotein alpha subunit
MSGIWVLATAPGGALTPGSRQWLATARALGDQLGTTVAALLLIGEADDPPPSQEAIAYGADKVFLLQDAHLARYSAPAYTAALAALAASAPPGMVLLGDDALDRDLAPRLAYRLGAGLIMGADPTTLEVDSYTSAPSAGVRRWNGRLTTTVAGTGTHPTVITLGAGAALEPYYDDWRYGDTDVVDLAALNVEWPGGLDTPEVADSSVTTETPDWHPQIAAWRALRGARVVVVGGAGLGSAEGFALVPRLAAAFGGEWGATGDAIEAGWAPPEREVSVRGVTVRPDLYIGLGVGGNPEEVVAMQQSRLVLAVAADPQTTLFRWATWGVVAHPATFAEQLLARLT